MTDAHKIAHSALALSYFIAATVLLADREVIHAICRVVAALVYGFLAHSGDGEQKF